jgi:hypothetical protein
LSAGAFTAHTLTSVSWREQTELNIVGLSRAGGCVRGGRFEPDHGANVDIPALLLGQIFDSSSGVVLVGKRELLVQIRQQHDRHRDEITGVLLIPPKAAGSREVNVKTTQIGKRTRITAGTKNENGGSRNEHGEILAAPVQIRVTSVTHHDGPGC